MLSSLIDTEVNPTFIAAVLQVFSILLGFYFEFHYVK